LKRDRESIFFDLIDDVKSMGFVLLEATSTTVKSLDKVSIVIFKESGVTTYDCEEVHNLMYHKCLLIKNKDRISLEVSSPSLIRKLKYFDEFSIFVGRNIKILKDSQWIYGKIKEATEDNVTIIEEKLGELVLDFEDIKKAQLDY
jgi:ribosome maturation factor RimP